MKKKMGKEALLQVMPTVLVGSNVGERANFMTVSMATIVSSKPAIIIIAVTPLRLTYSAIKSNGTFSVNIPNTEMVKITDYCGLNSGRKVDKSKLFDVFYGDLGNAPMIKECSANLECKLQQVVQTGNHDLFIGEIIETYINEECLTNGKPDITKLDPIIFNIKEMNYWKVGEQIGKAMNIGKDYIK